MPLITYREAVGKALREGLSQDENMLIVGEDVGSYGGAYAVTRGMLKEFGPRRVVDAPLSESAIIGACTGAAMGGLHPVAEIMTINFTLLAIDQIVNHAAKMRYMSNGQYHAPVIIRTVTGGGAQLGSTHSQCLEPWYATVPGLKVVTPATPYDALGLFRAVRQEQDPVVFAEHLLLYSSRGEVPDAPYVVPIGKAEVKRQGQDLTIVTYSHMVQVCLAAAQALEALDIDCEVIDLRSLRPWDRETVVESVKRTGHALVVEEAWRTGGFGAEVASTIQEEAFDYLNGPIGRIGGTEVPMPYNRELERAAIPSPERVVEAVRKALNR
ncbi:MAG: alpha-ketoacid dehydrogenase subunit beta [Chloroflexi bacterium]|nr:alpha-ketoacid dehydrogenase subunit beta [Chloroflexota bacterium]